MHLDGPTPPGPDERPPSRRRSHRIRQALLTPTTALAIVALVIAAGGTATAAKKASTAKAKRQLTSANVKDGSLTGVDVRNLNLAITEFDANARTLLRGAKGASGERGDQGPKGATGAQGPVGDQGSAAHVASKWSWFDTRYMLTNGDNSGPTSWNAYNDQTPGDGVDNGNVAVLNADLVNSLNRPFQTVLDLNSPGCSVGDVQGEDCPWGGNDGGGVTVAWDSNITAVANLSVMYTSDADALGVANAEQDYVPQTRLSCYLAANKGTGSTDFDQIGARVDVSGIRTRQLETMTLVGSINRTASTPTAYMVRVECRDADGTNSRTRWFVLGGSMSVVATERG